MKSILITIAVTLVLLTSLNLNATSLDKTPIVSAHEYQHHSQILAQKRRYMVSLPERYQINQRDFPTLYIIDADFQFQHVSSIVKHLTRMGKLPPMIVVGIANQGDDDYLKTTTWPDGKDDAFGGAAQFHTYLKQELLPTIDAQFRTDDRKALAGYSLGGLFTLYSMMQTQTPFNAFLAMSPSAWHDGNSLPGKVEPLLKQGKITSPVFISLANEEGMGVEKLIQVFEQAAPEKLNWQYKHYPNENHFTTALPALYDGLQFLAPDYAIDGTDMLAIGDYKQVLAHFSQQQKNWAGFQFEWLTAYQFAKYLFWSKQLDEVDNVLKAVKTQFPESFANVSIQLAKGFNKKQDFKRVAQLLNGVKAEGETLPGWHKQMSIYYKSTDKPELAKQHQEQALMLAKKYDLESWEVWELK
ncbi:alpha/beta hydrolase [Shewanella woodyi]|uniref:alpha/beta hydrolase n=1 Tax=Shewanella woodyi TaxID=60961 RepID=UPI0007F86A8D|nr:alpha/beta hydrolase-fold protein [Shewanella woodyi]